MITKLSTISVIDVCAACACVRACVRACVCVCASKVLCNAQKDIKYFLVKKYENKPCVVQ